MTWAGLLVAREASQTAVRRPSASYWVRVTTLFASVLLVVRFRSGVTTLTVAWPSAFVTVTPVVRPTGLSV